MNILFYYPSNQRTISIESVILKFKSQGHQVFLLTQTDKGELHTELENNGVKTYTCVLRKQNALLYYLKHLFFLIKFCNKNKINKLWI